MAQAQQAAQPNRQYNKKPGKPRFAHTENTKYGMGDYYGMGVRAPLGKIRDAHAPFGNLPNKKQLKSPPKKLA